MHRATVLTSQQSGNENADGLNLKAGYSLRDFNNLSSKQAAEYNMGSNRLGVHNEKHKPRPTSCVN